VDTSPASLAAFRSAIALDTYQANKYAALDQSPIPAPEQIVLRPPSPTATVTVSENIFGGPAPGTIQVIDDARGMPVRGATLVYLSGTTAKTDTHGLSMIPQRDPPIVLEQITAGVVVVPVQLKVDPQRGYVVQVDMATGTATQIVETLNPLAWPVVIQLGLLGFLVLFALGVLVARTMPQRSRVRRA